MSADDGFLTRWSRRKALARQAPPEAPAVAPETATGTAQPAQAGLPQQAEPAPGPAEFDLASLPALETITAATDVSVFLKAGVPESLRNAALRQVWAADPAIRDYVGLSEYAWDFNTPGAIEGFGEIAPGTDVMKIVRDIMDGMPSAPLPEVERKAQALLEATPDAQEREDLDLPDRAVAIAPEPPENPDVPAQAVPVRPRRRHGGATPG